MLENYSQKLVDDLYEEGDRDYHFLNEFLGFVGNLHPEKFMKNAVNLNKSESRQIEDALLLAGFFIASNAYVGFSMKEYGKPDMIFRSAEEFSSFVNNLALSDADFFEKINADERYTIGLMKIKAGAKSPQVTPEIEAIFREK